MEIESGLTVSAWEERSAREHLTEYATDGPNIDRFRILLESTWSHERCSHEDDGIHSRQHDLGSTVPASSNVFSHESRRTPFLAHRLGRLCRPRQSEITDLPFTRQ